MAKNYDTQRYIRTFRYIYNKWSILVIQYKSTLNLDLLYRIYICMNFVFSVYCNIVATYTYDGHTGFTFIWPFPAGFTSRHGLHNCEHDPSY